MPLVLVEGPQSKTQEIRRKDLTLGLFAKGESVPLNVEDLSNEEAHVLVQSIYETVKYYYPLDLLPFSVRSLNIFRINKLATVKDLLDYSRHDVMHHLKKCGPKSRAEIRDVVFIHCGINLWNWQ